MSEHAIEAENVGKRYRTQQRDTLSGVGFTVAPGSVLGLLGPNGAGKTTLVKLLCGVTRPSTGRITLFGSEPGADGGRAKRLVSAVHQETPFDNMLPLIDNIKIAAAFKGLRWKHVRERVERMLADFDLTASAGQLAFTLSGGQRRRVQMIRALLDIPRILILDEPSAGLDVSGRQQVWQLIGELTVQHGSTVVWTSHYLEEIERNCDRVLVLRGGRLIRDARPTDLVGEFGGRRLKVVLPEPADRERLRACLTGTATDVQEHSFGFLLSGPDAELRLPEIVDVVRRAGDRGAALEFQSPSLEDAFTALVDAGSGANQGALR